MPKWKQKAFEDLPAYRSALQEHCETPYLFFGFLHDEVKQAVADDDLQTAGMIVDYVRWCICAAPQGTDAGNDVCTMAMCGFVEHIPDDEASYAWIAGKWPHAFMLELREALTYHGEEEQFRRHVLRDG